MTRTMMKLLLPTLAAMLLGAAPAAAETPQEITHLGCTVYKLMNEEVNYCPEGEISMAQANTDLERLTMAPGLTGTLQTALGSNMTSWYFNYHRGQFVVRIPAACNMGCENKIAEEVQSRYGGWIPELWISWNANQTTDEQLAENKATIETGYSEAIRKYVAEGDVRILDDLPVNGLQWLVTAKGKVQPGIGVLEPLCKITAHLTSGCHFGWEL